MKPGHRAFVAALLSLGSLALAAPTLSFAQTAALTRTQVRADLARIEQAGYSPAHGDSENYPADIQAAQANLAAQDGQEAQQAQRAPTPADDARGGMSMHGSTQAGTRMRTPDRNACVGPVSFCNIFYGS